MSDAPKNEPGTFVVQHTMVGSHGIGEVIEITKAHIEKAGVDVARLLRLGAIREATKDEARHATKLGEGPIQIPGPIPQVPLQGQIPTSAAKPVTEEPAPTDVTVGSETGQPTKIAKAPKD